MAQHRRAAARGPHGLGKSGLAAWGVLWFALTRDALSIDWKIPTTASAWRQLTKYLWPEIHKWIKRINWNKVGRGEFLLKEELLSRALKLNYGEAFALASNRSELIEGAHADHILYVFAESKIIPDATWDSAEGAMVNDHAHWLAISTPGEPIGRFYHIHMRRPGFEDWWVRHVTLQEAIDAGRIGIEWANTRYEQWGERSAMYQNRVLGEFAQTEEEALIPLHWVEQAISRWYVWKEQSGETGVDQMGVDVARSGKDKTVFAIRRGNAIDRLEKYNKGDTMNTAGLLVPYIKGHPGVKIQIDIIGVGAGVYDRLHEQYEDNVFPFHAQESTDFVDVTELWEFRDCYSGAWWNMRDLLDPANGKNICLPPDDDMISDLTAPRWEPLSNGRIKVEPKKSVKERLTRSPDSGDAVVLAFWEPMQSGMEFA